MNQDREYIESRWESVRSFKSASGPWHVCDGTDEMEIWRATEAEALSAARKFTEAREEEIRQVREEISLLAYLADRCTAPQVVATARRILAREQSALDALLEGMKGTQ